MDYECPRLLLVQHEPQTAAMIGYRLQLLGYDVTTVDQGEDVMAEMELQIPDVILIDKRLPGIDGFEVAALLRADDRTAHVPILALSSDSSPEAVHNAFVAGATDYLITPFDPATLEHKIESLLTDVLTERV